MKKRRTQMDFLSRAKMLFGKEGIEKLKGSRVAVFGLGGVGGNAAEALLRSGVGALDLIDGDAFALTNLNRQLFATTKTLGMQKTEAAKARLLEINPEAKITVYPLFFLPENAAEIPFSSFDYIVDAVDTVTAKIALVLKAREFSVPIISSMGTGNKIDLTRLKVADIYSTSVCPLAKIMRAELKKRKIPSLKVVYSDENPILPYETEEKNSSGKPIPGSSAFVPPAAGLLLASEVVKDLLCFCPRRKGNA